MNTPTQNTPPQNTPSQNTPARTASARVDDAPLDHFEESLLRELKAIADEHPAPAWAGARMSQPRPGWQRPAVRVLAAAAAAAGIAGYLATPLGSSPAFAVTSEPNGDVTVTVNRPEGAQALEDALAAKGIRADVVFPTDGMQCRDGRYTEAPAATRTDRPFAFDAGPSGEKITIPLGLVGPDETLVLESMTLPPKTTGADGPQAPQGGQTFVMKVALATGSVAPCAPEPAEELPGMTSPGDLVPAGGSPTARVFPEPS